MAKRGVLQRANPSRESHSHRRSCSRRPDRPRRGRSPRPPAPPHLCSLRRTLLVFFGFKHRLFFLHSACEVEAWDDGPSHEAQRRLVQTPSDADICVVDAEGLENLPTRVPVITWTAPSQRGPGLVSHNNEIRSEGLRRTR